MFSTFLEQIGGYFNRRFILPAFFPTLAFMALSLGVIAAWWGPPALLEWWQAQPTEWQTLLVVGILGSVLVVAYLFYIFQTSITQFYEGYWEGVWFLNLWGQFRRTFYQNVWQYLEDETKRIAQKIQQLEKPPAPGETRQQWEARLQEARGLHAEMGPLEREWLLFFPPQKQDVMPTRLGNILRASEFYSLKRYGLDAVVAWPRLQSLLPPEFAADLRKTKANLDLFLVLTTQAALFALGWQIVLGGFTHRWDLFLLTSLGWLVALFAYRGALQAARVYGELIKAAFDLHRWELLKALHLKLPDKYKDERELWQEVNGLLYRNYPPNPHIFRYETP